MQKSIIYFLPIIIYLFFCGCETVKTRYVGIDSLNVNYSNDTEKAIVKITGIILKNGTVVDLNDRNPKVEKIRANFGITYDESEDSYTREIEMMNNISLVRIEIVKDRNLGTPIIITFCAAIFIYFLIGLGNIK